MCPPCPACSPCPACAMISMTSPASLPHRSARPSTLPGIQSLHRGGRGVGRHQDGLHHLSPVHMHPDPDTLSHSHLHRNTGFFCFYFYFILFCVFLFLVVDLEPHPHSQNYASWPAVRPGPPSGHNNISIRRKNFPQSRGKFTVYALEGDLISVTL